MLIETTLLEQLDAFARYGTLSAASKELHLTQPTLTRSMHKLEQQVGVPLFERGNRSIRLNENGIIAADFASRILSLEDEMITRIYFRERLRNTVSFGADSPAPVREIAPVLSEILSGKTVSADVKSGEELLEGLQNGRYWLISLNHPVEGSGYYCARVFGERLYYCCCPGDFPAGTDGVLFEDLDGRDVLMFEGTGFWKDLLKEHLPHSNIIVLDDNDKVNFLVERSNLPAFSSDAAIRHNIIRPNRVPLPVLDDAAYADHYCICKAADTETVKLINCIVLHAGLEQNA